MIRNPRKLLFIVVILLYLPTYALIAGNIYVWMGRLPLWLELIYFVAAGMAWVFPLKPFLKWFATSSPKT